MRPALTPPLTAPLVPSITIQTTVLRWCAEGVRGRRTAPMSRTTASDAARDEALAVEVVGRCLTPTVAPWVEPSEPPDEPNDACSELVEDT